MYANTVAEAHRTLMRGFTTVRDVGGSTFGLKAAIDSGVIPGPGVFPSGPIRPAFPGVNPPRSRFKRCSKVIYRAFSVLVRDLFMYQPRSMASISLSKTPRQRPYSSR